MRPLRYALALIPLAPLAAVAQEVAPPPLPVLDGALPAGAPASALLPVLRSGGMDSLSLGGPLGEAVFYTALPGAPDGPDGFDRSGYETYSVRFTYGEASFDTAYVRRVYFAQNADDPDEGEAGSGDEHAAIEGAGTLRVGIYGVRSANPPVNTLLVPDSTDERALAERPIASFRYPEQDSARRYEAFMPFSGPAPFVRAGEDFAVTFRVVDFSEEPRARFEFLLDDGCGVEPEDDTCLTAPPEYFPARTLLYVTEPSVPPKGSEGWYWWSTRANQLVSVVLSGEPGGGVGNAPLVVTPALSLDPARPNPTAAGAFLDYRLDRAGPVRLDVLDVLGRVVLRVAEGTQAAGAHSAYVEAGRLAPGRYAVRLVAGDAVAVRPLTVVR